MGRADAAQKRPRRLPRIARLLVPLLGIFFLVHPIQVVFGSDPTPARAAIALGGAALFACVFLIATGHGVEGTVLGVFFIAALVAILAVGRRR